jgi:hypothetical protein
MRRENRVRKLIKLDIKKEIISKRESGKSVGDLRAEYGMAKPTISTTLKNKEEIKYAQVDEETRRTRTRKKVTAFQLRTLKRCSLAGINCPNL